MNRRKNSVKHKAKQLCSQIRWALEYVVNEQLEPNECVLIADVLPYPNTLNILVVAQPYEKMTIEEVQALEEKLFKQTGRLRAAVAQAIHRKKTPSLSFRVLPKGTLD